MKKCVCFVVHILLSVLSVPLAGCGTPKFGPAPEVIEMAFVPSGDLEEIAAGCDHLADMIADSTGLYVEGRVAIDYAGVREAMGEGKAQTGWLAAFNYVLANEEYNVDVGLVTDWSSAPTTT